MIDFDYIPKDEKGNLYCVCGYKPNQFNIVPSFEETCRQRIMMEKHAETCKKWQKHELDCKCKSMNKELQYKEFCEKQRIEDEAYERKFNTKLIIGWFLILFGFILMISLGVSSAHQYAWLGLLIVFIGFFVILGFGGLLGVVFGSLIDGLSHTGNLIDLSRDITTTQQLVKNNNTMINKDIFGNNLNNNIKK